MELCQEIAAHDLSLDKGKDIFTPWDKIGWELFLAPTSQQYFDAILAPYGMKWEGFFWSAVCSDGIQGWPVWAFVAMPRELWLAGHALSTRGNSHDIRFSSYSWVASGSKLDLSLTIPPISFLMIRTKEALKQAASISPLFENAWELLKEKPDVGHWFCIPELPPEDWLAARQMQDNQLFQSVNNLATMPQRLDLNIIKLKYSEKVRKEIFLPKFRLMPKKEFEALLVYCDICAKANKQVGQAVSIMVLSTSLEAVARRHGNLPTVKPLLNILNWYGDTYGDSPGFLAFQQDISLVEQHRAKSNPHKPSAGRGCATNLLLLLLSICFFVASMFDGFWKIKS